MKTVETLLRAHWREQTLLVAVKGLMMYCTYEQYTGVAVAGAVHRQNRDPQEH